MQVGSKAVVSGKDFDPDTGDIKEKLDAFKLVSRDQRCLRFSAKRPLGQVVTALNFFGTPTPEDVLFSCFTSQFLLDYLVPCLLFVFENKNNVVSRNFLGLKRQRPWQRHCRPWRSLR